MSLRNTRGFSLIELAVVVLIAGLILAMTMPTINRYLMGARLRDAAARVAGEMRLARQKSVTNNSLNRIWVATNFNYYYTGERRWLGGTTWAPVAWKGPFYLPATVKLIAPNWNGLNYFWYTTDGRPTTDLATGPVSGSVKLVTTAGEPDTLTINVDLSGSVWQ
jgi:prepilin-type N-terminal cleavage/methylation domain-containing protein